MSLYQVMPPLTPDELSDLYADIEANGVRVPVDVDEDGNILDGHHRAEIATALGIGYPIRELVGLTEDEKVAHAYAVNLNRRSLNREQKRALVQASLLREPQLSDLAHARRTGVSDKTVAAVRDEMESRSDIPNVTERVDSLGRIQPSTKPAHVTTTTRVSEATKIEQDIDLETGEVIDSATRAGRAAADAVMDVVESDAGYRSARLMRDITRSLGTLPPFEVNPEEAAELPFEEAEIRAFERARKDMNDWTDRFLRARSGLRLIAGGKQ